MDTQDSQFPPRQMSLAYVVRLMLCVVDNALCRALRTIFSAARRDFSGESSCHAFEARNCFFMQVFS
jgi:hypothetical protein